MSAGEHRYVYGPVPSRRLGRSLGIDLVPYKTCTYDCVYCQLGRTTNKTLERKAYVPLEEVLDELERKLDGGDVPDIITLAGSGEPTLHSGIGGLIERIRDRTDIPVAVLTNGSLLWMEEVRDALMGADLVLPSLDAGDEQLFRTVNRPHEGISFEAMVDGMAEFTRQFPREVWLEVLLLAGLTGMPAEARKIGERAGKIGPARIQLNTACRPPVEEFAFPVPPERMEALKSCFPGTVELICEYGEGFEQAGGAAVGEAEVMALLKRRPCTVEDVAAGLGIHRNEAIKRLQGLEGAGAVVRVKAGARNLYRATGKPREDGSA